MASFASNIERFFRQRSVLSNLILINIAVFLILQLTGVVCMLFKIDSVFPGGLIELPAQTGQLLLRPWTLITYMFVHYNFLHILFNLLWLYWFGQIFLLFFNPRQLGGLYVLGGLAGALFFILSYNLFPYFRDDIDRSYLLGASASVMAIVFAAAFYRKDFEIRLLFLGSVKLIYIALFCLVLDLISIQSDNPGGHIAHIGGALLGIWFAGSYRKGKDITNWINPLIDGVVNLFKRRNRSPRKKMKIHYRRPENDQEYNNRRAKENSEIDRILEKIKHSGYDSLTDEEKRKLFDVSKK